jgi:hypothetical protein
MKIAVRLANREQAQTIDETRFTNRQETIIQEENEHEARETVAPSTFENEMNKKKDTQ